MEERGRRRERVCVGERGVGEERVCVRERERRKGESGESMGEGEGGRECMYTVCIHTHAYLVCLSCE